jgi:hypothetical protein
MLQKQDVTPLIVQMPASWNKPRTRVRVKFAGTFQLPNPGDVFLRKFWIGKTQITQASSQGIRPTEARYFSDTHEIVLTGDNLWSIQSVHHTALASCGSWVGQTIPGGIQGDSTKFGGAIPATSELSFIDAPLIIDDDWNKLSVSFYCTLKSDKAIFTVRDYSVEQISL